MKKRSQITVFIILGLIFFLIIGLVVYKIADINKKKLGQQGVADYSRVMPVENFVQSCVQLVGTEAVTKLGQQGRIYPQAFIQSPTSSVSYFYYKGNGFFPSRVQYLEEDISRYVMENLDECLADFSDFDYPIETDDSRLRVKTSFNERDATIILEYPITVTLSGSKTTVSEFSAKIDFEFLPIYDLSKRIYEKTQAEPDWVDVDFLAEQPYDIRLIKIDDQTLLYEITDDDALNDEPYVYRFAMKYNL